MQQNANYTPIEKCGEKETYSVSVQTLDLAVKYFKLTNMKVLED